MAILLDGTGGVTTPGVVNTAGETIATTLVVTGVTTLTGGLNAALPVLSGGTGVTTKTGTGAVVLGTSPTLVTPALGNAMAASIKFNAVLFEIGTVYGPGDYTGIQGVSSSRAAFLVLAMGNNTSGASTSALYLVNPRVANGNDSTSAIRIAGDAGISLTFSYVATDIFRVTNTSTDSFAGWKCIG